MNKIQRWSKLRPPRSLNFWSWTGQPWVESILVYLVPIPAAYQMEAQDYKYSTQNGSTCSQYTAWSAEISQAWNYNLIFNLSDFLNTGYVNSDTFDGIYYGIWQSMSIVMPGVTENQANVLEREQVLHAALCLDKVAWSAVGALGRCWVESFWGISWLLEVKNFPTNTLHSY